MNANRATLLIIYSLLSVFLWGVSLYNGWINEAILFGYNTFTSWVGITPHISTRDDVTRVKHGEFAYKLLTKINIPDNIKTIENGAFKGNILTSITIGSNVKLEIGAFGSGNGSNFEYFYNKNGMDPGTYRRPDHISMKWSIWHGNFEYTKVYGNNTTVKISNYDGAAGTIIIPDEINGNPVTDIEVQAFSKKGLTGVTIPSAVTSIRASVFKENQLTSITIPTGITSIGDYAFSTNQLTSITIPAGVTSIGDSAFRENQLTEVFFPNSVKSIGINAFDKNQITRVSIGANVSLGSDNSGNFGILGEGTGFNTAYKNNNSRAGIYSRPDTKTSKWTRSPPATSVGAQTTPTAAVSPTTVPQNRQQISQSELIASNMVQIPGGTFTMGSPKNEVVKIISNELNQTLDSFEMGELAEIQHQVTVSGFYMGKYEVTQSEWREVMGNNPSIVFKETNLLKILLERFGNANNLPNENNLPVNHVSWYDAVEYCNKRSIKEGLSPAYTIDKTRADPDNKSKMDKEKWLVTWNRGVNGYRLPTEAEWEYACRAGTTTPYFTGTTMDSAGWHSGNSNEKTHPIGEKQANAWGLYDMHGNVAEWCWDWFEKYSSNSQTDPVGASSGSDRVTRGGNWFYPASYSRSAARSDQWPSVSGKNLGFRLVRPLF